MQAKQSSHLIVNLLILWIIKGYKLLIFFEVSRYLLNEQIKNFPFYNEARKAIPGEEAWKYQPNVGDTEDKEYKKSLVDCKV